MEKATTISGVLLDTKLCRAVPIEFADLDGLKKIAGLDWVEFNHYKVGEHMITVVGGDNARNEGEPVTCAEIDENGYLGLELGYGNLVVIGFSRDDFIGLTPLEIADVLGNVYIYEMEDGRRAPVLDAEYPQRPLRV